MALTITASTYQRQTNKFQITLDGSYSSTVDSIAISITDQDGVTSSLVLADHFDLPVAFPATYVLTNEMFELSSDFSDGVYEVELSVAYIDPSIEQDSGYFLFDGNIAQAWFSLVSELACISSNGSGSKKQKQITEAREIWNAASESFNLTRFTEAKELLDYAKDITNK